MTRRDEEVDRALGAFLGLAIGDALGTTKEFEARDRTPPLSDMVGGGPFCLAPGQWTDDTSMAWALAESLAQCRAFDATDLMERFVAWWQTGAYSSNGVCFDIGITTRQALERFVETGNPLAGTDDPMSAGNGALMRLAPVALWGLRVGEAAMRRTARQQSATTHAAAACLDASEAFAVMLFDAIRGGSKDSVLENAGRTQTGGEIRDVLAGRWRSKSRRGIASSGYVVHTLEAALWCVAGTDGFEEAALMAANLGDDADTVAAVTGQLAGAIYGAQAIPAPWLLRLAKREDLEAAARSLIESEPRVHRKSGPQRP